MGKMDINVQIVTGNGLGGVYPFVVVCFENDLTNEVYKSAAVNGGPTCTWDESFPLDLTSEVKNIVADGKPEPGYLTFFVFDSGTPGLPSLGSAGVLLSTVRDAGVAKGDFQIVNGKGSLSLVVEQDKKSWYQTDAAKIAGVTGAVGVAGLAAGLTALAIKKKKKGSEDEDDADTSDKKKKKGLIPGLLARVTGGGGDDSEEEEEEEEEDDDDDDPNVRAASQVAAGQTTDKADKADSAGHNVASASARPWWHPESSDEDGEGSATRRGEPNNHEGPYRDRGDDDHEYGAAHPEE